MYHRTTTEITYVHTLHRMLLGRVHKKLSGSILSKQGTQYAHLGSILCSEHIVALQRTVLQPENVTSIMHVLTLKR